jgi:hypothetical protein
MMQRLLFIIGIFFSCLLFSTDTLAQKSDPYGNPTVWEKLKKDPNNRQLWSKYMKKKWSEMSAKDKRDVEAMKQQLYIEAIAEEESIIGLQEKKAPKASEVAFKGVAAPKTKPDRKKGEISGNEVKQLAHVEAIIMEQPVEIEDLKSSVATNFVILEDKFRETFEALGETYRYYHEVHPDGDYSELKWIEEKETHIRLLKQKRVDALRKNYRIVK